MQHAIGISVVIQITAAVFDILLSVFTEQNVGRGQRAAAHRQCHAGDLFCLRRTAFFKDAVRHCDIAGFQVRAAASAAVAVLSVGIIIITVSGKNVVVRIAVGDALIQIAAEQMQVADLPNGIVKIHAAAALITVAVADLHVVHRQVAGLYREAR